MSKSDYLEAKVLDDLFGIAAFTPPATVYVALLISAPTDAGGGTEVTGGSYARAAVTNDATNWTRTGSVVSNSAAITFAQASGAWGTVGWFELRDALTGGNQLFWGPLTTARTIVNGDTFSFAIAQLQFTED